MAFCAQFDIDLPRALRDQLVEALDRIGTGVLNEINLAEVPMERGVYQLYYKGELVYVGKAQKLRSRLRKHFRKIEGRSNLVISEITFKCLWMSANWITLAPEAQLIALYKSKDTAKWNGNGFGPNDPGAGREDRNDPPAQFDKLYPIRENWPCETIYAGRREVLPLLKDLKKSLPYLFRFQRASPDYDDVAVDIPSDAMPVCEVLRLISAALPTGWQATRFPSHMILYKKLRPFQYGTIIFPEPGP
jgi:hypothetical protein